MPRGPGAGDVYGGRTGRTRVEDTPWSCACGELVVVPAQRGVDAAADPALAADARRGGLPVPACPACGRPAPVDVAFVYHDGPARRFVLVIPAAQRHRELEERAALLTAMAGDRVAVPAYAREPEVVFGAEELRRALARPRGEAAGGGAAAEALAARAHELDRREAELGVRAAQLDARAAELAELTARPGPPPAGPVVARSSDATGPYEQIDDSDVDVVEGSALRRAPERDPHGTRPGGAGPVDEVGATDAEGGDDDDDDDGSPARDLDAERWIASREPARAVAAGKAVRLFARIDAAHLEAFLAGTPVPTLQLFRLSTYPLVVLSVRPAVSEPDADAPVRVILDLARVGDRGVLGNLAHDFSVELELFDRDNLPVVHHRLHAPLEENARQVLAAGEAHLAGLPAGQRRFEAAVAAFTAPGFDRQVKRARGLAENSFKELVSAHATAMALDVVAFWSEAGEHETLVLERGFPLAWWWPLRRRVLERAVQLGLALPASLAPAAVSEGLARSRKDLAGVLARAFAETCRAGSDLEAPQVQANWRALVAECEALGVALDGDAADRAAQAVGALAPSGRRAPEPSTEVKRREVEVARRAMSSPVVAGEIGGSRPKKDVKKASVGELVDLLEDKDLRRDAAFELCRRADPTSVGPVFGAVRRMTRNEAVRVLPMVSRFGERGVPHLLDGLRSRKGFLRHGCALALGLVKSAEGIEPLCDLLLSEPTDVWREVARAVGEIGPGAIMSLAARVKTAEPEVRERLAWALAHVVARGGRGPVETLAAGRDPVAGGVARRALELADQARDNDAEVRGARPLVEQTVNRAFSRRFFEAMRAGANGAGGACAGAATFDDLDDVPFLAEDMEEMAELEEVIDEDDLIPG